MSDSEESLAWINSTVEFWIVGVLITTLSIVGILGNIFSILVLRKGYLSNFSETFVYLVRWLAFIDSLFLVTCLLLFCIPVLSHHYKTWIFPYILPSCLPISSICFTASLYCLVALSFERYFAITNSSQVNKGSFFGYILPVLTFSICFNFPKFFEYSTKISRNNRPPQVYATEFRESSDYTYYILGSGLFFLGILPFAILIFLNLKIIEGIKKNTAAQKLSMNLFLFGLVGVQLISNTPRNILNVSEICLHWLGSDMTGFQEFSWVVDLSHLLLALSASSNVLVFSIQDRTFRTSITEELESAISLYRNNAGTRGRFEPVTTFC